MSINKNKAFHKWLGTCPFKISKMDFQDYGLTSVTFIWDDVDDWSNKNIADTVEEVEKLEDKYQSIDRHNEDYFVREN